MEDFNFALILPLLVLQFILVVIALVDLVKRDRTSLRGENKWIWLLIILFLNTIGPILYFVVGKKK